MRKTKLPDKPGVYLFLDKKGEILYIGRATLLKRRVASYFRNDLDPRIKEMVGLAAKIEHYVTETVLESFILEANLIKKLIKKLTKENPQQAESLKHIRDASLLIREDIGVGGGKINRLEFYDIY